MECACITFKHVIGGVAILAILVLVFLLGRFSVDWFKDKGEK